uniref:Phage portal protein, lambda family n=1 Tax=Candidatus Kentrum sp. TUN TaxID=2126343 RepID=A0A450ZTD1_9GAMM|nr:MAG: Phage portal protein, lambda family [Candidatus Kentron sp. TUN]
MLHVFEPDRLGQTRDKTGIAAILAKSKTLGRFQDVNLEAAIVNAIYAAIIKKRVRPRPGRGDIGRF